MLCGEAWLCRSSIFAARSMIASLGRAIHSAPAARTRPTKTTWRSPLWDTVGAPYRGHSARQEEAERPRYMGLSDVHERVAKPKAVSNTGMFPTK